MGSRTTRTHLVRIFVLGIYFMAAMSIFAGGKAETEGDHHDHDHHHEETEEIRVELEAGEMLSVVATTSIVGDVVRNVAGDAAEVTVLMGLGQNPHSWEPSARDLVAIEEAHILFVNGVNLEEGLMESLEMQHAGNLVEVSHGIEILGGGDHDHEGEDEHEHEEEHEGEHEDEHEGEHDHDHAAGDPHTWFSPLNVVTWVENIEHALSEADPANADVYEENAHHYVDELMALDGEIRERFASIPVAERKLVIDHAALGYFTRDYDFTILGTVIPTFSDQAEPSAGEVAELIERVEADDISAIFVGGTAGDGLVNLVNTVAAEVDREISVLTLLTGSLSAAGTPGDTYLGFVRFNTGQIALGLSGSN